MHRARSEGTQSTMPASRIVRLALATALVAGVSVGLAACVPPSDPSGDSTESGRPTPSKTPSPTPTKPPVMLPNGTATANLPFFDYVNLATFASAGFVEGRPYIDNLVANGFNKADMELTWWDTPDGHLADSIFFSVRFKGECLVGQIAAWGYASSVSPILSTGSCMVGAYLQPIDW